MTLDQRMNLINHNIEIGGYSIVAKECVSLIEQALRQLFREQLTRLEEKDRLRIQDVEQKTGKGQKGAERFTMGQLVHLFRASRFLDAWERVSGKDLSNIRVINLDELTELRNRFIHDNRDATRSEAEFLVNCLRVILETFDIASFNHTGKTSAMWPKTHNPVMDAALRDNRIQQSFTDGHALIIGVGADLPDTVNDAIGFANLLKDPSRCAYARNQVTLLTGEQATRQVILSAFDTLAQTTDVESTVIVYFSGHGYQVVSTIGEVYYLMPYGYDVHSLYTTAISGVEFTNKLKMIPAKKLLVLLDCCHAGGVSDTRAPDLHMTKKPLPQEVLPLLSEGEGRVLIASSREDELSFAGKPYSAFTLALTEAFCGIGVTRQDGYVRVTDLALHARKVVLSRTHGKQHPILHFEQADNFVLAYYAGGETQSKGLPFTGTPEIEPSPGAQASSRNTLQNAIITGGGNITVTGNGNLIGGNISIGDGNTIGQGNVKR